MRHESTRAAFEVVSVGSRKDGYTTVPHTHPDTVGRLHPTARPIAARGTLAVTSLQPQTPLHGPLRLQILHASGAYLTLPSPGQALLRLMVERQSAPENHRVVQMQGDTYKVLATGPVFAQSPAPRGDSLGNAKPLSKGQQRKLKRKAS